jgi:hypothetical protein
MEGENIYFWKTELTQSCALIDGSNTDILCTRDVEEW